MKATAVASVKSVYAQAPGVQKPLDNVSIQSKTYKDKIIELIKYISLRF